MGDGAGGPQSSGLEHVIFRPSFVFGRDGGVAAALRPAGALVAGHAGRSGSGERRLQPIWVEDVAAYFAEAVDLPAAANRTFELGGPDAVTWNELYERIARTLGKRRGQVHVPIAARARGRRGRRAPARDAPLTRDQLTMLEAGDNVVRHDARAGDVRHRADRRSTSSCAARPEVGFGAPCGGLVVLVVALGLLRRRLRRRRRQRRGEQAADEGASTRRSSSRLVERGRRRAAASSIGASARR